MHKAEQTRIIFEGKNSHLSVIVNKDEYEKWRKDDSIALVQVVQSYDIFESETKGASGMLEKASKATIENETGHKNNDDAILKILKEGKLNTTKGGAHSEKGKQI